MLDNLKLPLKDLVAKNRLAELFRRLREEVLRPGSELYNDAISLEGKWNENQRNDNLGTIDFRDAKVTSSSLNKALLEVIDQIEKEDLSERYRKIKEDHVFISADFHLTCDRVEQNDAFLEIHYDPPEALFESHDGKVRFFYLQGDLRQVQDGFVERIGKQLGGFLYNFDEGSYDPEHEPVIVKCKPQTSKNPVVFQIETIKKILSEFDVRLEPAQKKRLSDLKQSKKLLHKGEDDVVLILLTLDDHNWDKELTPALVRNLYEKFCDCQLPDDSPSFFFFFGLEYSKENTRIQQEISQAIAQAQYGIALPTLEPATIEDVAEWLSRVKEVLTPGTDTTSLAKSWFPNSDRIDMADVYLRLEKFINDHNNGLFFTNE